MKAVVSPSSPAGAAPDVFTHVGDAEVLYRRVRYNRNEYKLVDGRVRVASIAFADSTGNPSVDRAILRDNDPHATQGGDETNAVLTLTAAEVRALAPVAQQDAKGKTIGEKHVIDVHPDPVPAKDGTPENLSHAEIRPSPQFPETSRLREKLQLALARLVNGDVNSEQRWAIAVWESRTGVAGWPRAA